MGGKVQAAAGRRIPFPPITPPSYLGTADPSPHAIASLPLPLAPPLTHAHHTVFAQSRVLPLHVAILGKKFDTVRRVRGWQA